MLFVVDAQSGVVPLDLEVAERLRRIDKPKLLVVNKCDSTRTDAEVHEFRRLCEAPLIVTSVKANRNRDELIDGHRRESPAAVGTRRGAGNELSADPELKLAIVGRRNVGKSTFINALAESERVIVSEIPGTTRDSVDIRFEVDGKRLLAIDTPGVRKRKSLATDVEFYGLVRAQRSIRRADVVFMFFDAKETISRVDIQLVDEIAKHNKPCVFVVNKWDSVPEMTTEAWSDYLLQTFATMRYVPVAFLTAKEGRNVRKLVNLAQNLFKQTRLRVSTGQTEPRRAGGDRWPISPPCGRIGGPRFIMRRRSEQSRPTIVLKCNDPAVFDEAWKRYLLGRLARGASVPGNPDPALFPPARKGRRNGPQPGGGGGSRRRRALKSAATITLGGTGRSHGCVFQKQKTSGTGERAASATSFRSCGRPNRSVVRRLGVG